MTDTQPCPRESQLKSLLDGMLAGEVQAALAVHLDACAGCRDQLERLASQDAEFVQEKALLDGKTHGSDALKQIMEKLKLDTAGWPKTGLEASAGPLNLDFLSPSPNRRHLGRLDDYEVLEVIGRGGMGTVLKARDPKLERLVAVKVLNGELASSGPARTRFLREARSAAAVTHEHVVTIHAVDDSAEVPFLVMEYIVGVSLEDRIQRSGHLKVEEILRIGMQVASGLAAAHTQGLVHRDIKPSNILLENGVERVKITDFGLARVVHEAQITQSNLIAGTPQYMSPEQARGEPVDHRSDLFSLGCVLYAMCVGRSPFRAETLAGAIHRVCEDQPRPIKEINPDIPNWLVVVIDRLLAKDRDERFQTAREVAELLGQYLAHVQQPSRIALPAGRGLKVAQSRQNWPAWSKLAAAVAGIAVIAALMIVPNWELFHSVKVVKSNRSATGQMPPDGTPDKKPGEGQRHFVQVDLEPFANRRLADGTDSPDNHFGDIEPRLVVDQVPFQVGPRYMQLAGHKISGCPQEVRGIEVNDMAEKVHILHGTGWTGGLPNQHVATYTFHYEDGTSQPFRIVTGRHLREWWHPADVLNLATRATRAWSGNNPATTRKNVEIQVYACTWVNPHPDKKIVSVDFERGPLDLPSPFCLAMTLDDDSTSLPPEPGLLVVSFGQWAGDTQYSIEIEGSSNPPIRGSGRHERLLPAGRRHIQIRYGDKIFRSGSIDVIPGNVSWLTIDAPQTLFPLPETPPEPVAELAAQGGSIDAVVTPDGRDLVSAARDGTVVVWRNEEGTWIRRAELPPISGPSTLALSPAGEMLALGCQDGSVSLWDMATCELQATLRKHGPGVITVAFSPSGPLLVAGYGDGTIDVWNVDTKAKSGSFRAFSEGVNDVLFSPDGTLLATGGWRENAVKLWDVATWKIHRELSGHADSVSALSFSPDGKMLASAGRDGVVNVWSMETGKSLHRFFHPQGLLAVAFDPAGKKLAAGGSFQTVRIWDIAAGQVLHDFQAHWDNVNSLQYSTDGKTLITTGDFTARLWDVARLPGPFETDVHGLAPKYTVNVHEDWSMCAVFSPKVANLIAAVGVKPDAVSVWDLGAFTRTARFRAFHSDNEYTMRQSIAFGPGERELTTCVSKNGKPRLAIWQPLKGTNRAEFETGTFVSGQDFSVAQMGVSFDGKTIVVASWSERLVSLIDLETCETKWSVSISHGGPSCAAISADGNIVAIGTEQGRLILLDAKTGKSIREPQTRSTSGIYAVAFSPEGVLATASQDGAVCLWDPESLEEIPLPSAHQEGLFSAAFSPDGRLLVTAGGAQMGATEPWTHKGEICLWDVANRKLITKFDAHYGSVMCAVFSPDGKRLATTGRDGKLNLWDVDELLQNAQ